MKQLVLKKDEYFFKYSIFGIFLKNKLVRGNQVLHI